MKRLAEDAARLRTEASYLDAAADRDRTAASRLWTCRRPDAARAAERRAEGRDEDAMALKLRAAELEAILACRSALLGLGA